MSLQVHKIEPLKAKERADVRQLIEKLSAVIQPLAFGGDSFKGREEDFVDALRWMKFYMKDIKWLLEEPK